MERLKYFFEELYKNFNDRKIDAVIAHTTPDVKWANGMEGGYVHGHHELKDYWTRQFALINPKVTPYEIELDGDNAKIKIHQVVYDLSGQLLQNKKLFHHFHMQHDKVEQFEIGEEVTD